MKSTTQISPNLMDELTEVVSRAAAAVMTARAGALAMRLKSDQSPVTAADAASQAVILDGLARLLPGVPVISEEATEGAPAPPSDGLFVLVDPVDGTRELIEGRDEFTVNVALVENGRPLLGLISSPALSLLWRAAQGLGVERLRLTPGAAPGAATERMAIRPRPWLGGPIRAAVSRSHLNAETEAWLQRLPQVERVVYGSAAKFCLVADGTVDVFPRLAASYEWDVAAGDAILSLAGGAVLTRDGLPLCYCGRPDVLVPGFVAWGDPSVARQLGDEH